ncbi:MBOAT family protein [Ideonella sp. A 288]|uniref:MBOAT family O-acyltransferase n=1 Tax=Ideonella sp. A 288 TaxID=1962181 RepID=UPI000B4B6655|nr:MBOAT family protein [Ideonella sp. A 288]
MLFTTGSFLLAYLPITWMGFFLLGRFSHGAAAAWLFLASVFFYSYWMPLLTLLLVASMSVNFLLGRRISDALQGTGSVRARAWMVAGIVFNLGLLAYFKYANFLVDNLNAALGFDWHLGRIVLPIGISFYTFTQIAFLVDAYEGKVREVNPVHYGLFVTYFPHLVAGPVLHHKQMMPQFADASIYRPRVENIVCGLVVLALGLFKKVVLADGVAPYADAVFSPAVPSAVLTTGEAWLGAVAYTLQLYFDFSGYSDMAVGLSLLFNVRLPYNFNSPYQARNISDFWRRWHISLSTFLRDYLYIPLGGNRGGPVRRYANLATTMLLGGLWHGASWSFVIWGGLHGLYLMVNHGFRAALGEALRSRLERVWLYGWCSWALTLLAVVVAWVYFRAETLAGAHRILLAMAGWNMPPVAEASHLWNAGLNPSTGVLWCVVLAAAALFLRNSNHIGQNLAIRVMKPSVFRAVIAGAALAAVAMTLLVNATRSSVSAFIYFNF